MSHYQGFEAVEFVGAIDEILRKIRRHEGNTWFVAAFAEIGDEGVPFLGEVEEVRLAHPARELVEMQFGIGRSFDGIDADALLAGVAPLLCDHRRLHGRGGHEEDEELDGIDGFGELFPPADAAFEQEPILLDDNVGSVGAEALAEGFGEVLAVSAGVGEKDAATLVGLH